tara:strand:- start:511 stop:729 length:219 start_codon:yes stop_codon:yes gene_type:complete
MNREPYWDYMGRRLREEDVMDMEETFKKEIAQMQEQVHGLQMRVKHLTEDITNLKYKVGALGGDPNQLELEL